MLKYTFVDSLDVDPTFEEYLDDYKYCVQKNLFEQHKDLTPFTNRQSDWNDAYWEKIKRDLLKNFSRERLDYMRKVAPVVLADKVARLQKERQNFAQTVTPKFSQLERPVTSSQPRIELPTKSKAQQQQEELEAAKQKLAQDNAEFERQQHQHQERLRHQQQVSRQTKDDSPKKSLGIAPLIIIATVVAVIIFVLLK